MRASVYCRVSTKEKGLEVTLAEVRQALADFPTVWEALTLEERREMLRLLIEELKVFKPHAELKLVFLDPVRIALDFVRTKGEWSRRQRALQERPLDAPIDGEWRAEA
jgi:hypothetical protein